MNTRLGDRHVIVGAGEAGTRAALALRDAGAQRVTLIGAEACLPYERPPLSKPEGNEITVRAITTDFAGIDTQFGRWVSFVDRSVRQLQFSDGEHLSYDWLLLATGARARPLPRAENTRVLTLRTCDDAAAIYAEARAGRCCVIIGAGLIGLELAAVMRGRGMLVTVLEAGARAMSRVLPQDLSDEIVARHRLEGVRIVFGANIVATTAQAVVLDDGEEVVADLIVAAIGAVPNSSLAEDIGLTCGNGIHVDDKLQTSDPRIFSAGDCAAVEHPLLGRIRFESWRSACDQGVAAADAMLGNQVKFATYPWFWSDQYDLGIQMVGLHDPSRQTIRRQLQGDGWIFFEIDPDGVLCAASGVARGHGVAKDIRLSELLIERRVAPSREALADPSVNLKSLLPRS
ncbi:hypothetical protein A6U87_26145 [Rhizobium sp. AC44/96]|nr:hypothetical protein A6U87_26145 [Rhizobium sp. AC44/96]